MFSTFSTPKLPKFNYLLCFGLSDYMDRIKEIAPPISASPNPENMDILLVTSIMNDFASVMGTLPINPTRNTILQDALVSLDTVQLPNITLDPQLKERIAISKLVKFSNEERNRVVLPELSMKVLEVQYLGAFFLLHKFQRLSERSIPLICAHLSTLQRMLEDDDRREYSFLPARALFHILLSCLNDGNDNSINSHINSVTFKTNGVIYDDALVARKMHNLIIEYDTQTSKLESEFIMLFNHHTRRGKYVDSHCDEYTRIANSLNLKLSSLFQTPQIRRRISMLKSHP